MDKDEENLSVQVKDFISLLKNQEHIEVQSSGTTGDPKTFFFPTSALLASAQKTIDFFQIKKGDRLGLCLPLRFIGGKMMVCRAFLANAKLICLPEKLNPLKDLDENLDFLAMTPAQFFTVLEENPEKIKLVKTILLGGAKVSKQQLKKYSKHFFSQTNLFESFGMSETLSHIAIKNLKKENADFEILKGIKITQDEKKCLVIEVDFLPEKIHTHDIIILKSNTSFEFVARAQDIINSGGIKIFPSVLEEKISFLFPNNRFCFLGISDPILGEKLVLVTENQEIDSSLQQKIIAILEPHQRPKLFFSLHHFPITASGKIQKNKIIEQIIKLIVI